MAAIPPASFLNMRRRRALLATLVALAVLWPTVTITGSAILTDSDPVLAARLSGLNSRSLERRGFVLASKVNKASAGEAQRLAVQSLVASPLSAEGAVTLAVTQSVLQPAVDAFPAVAYSEFLSRRIALTEMLLIEHWVAKEDIRQALRSYDHLFRVNDTFRPQFLPVLAAATLEPEVTREMVRLLATRPPWRQEYYGALLGAFPGTENFARLVKAFRFDPANPDDRERLSLGLVKLVEQGRPELAYALYRDTVGLKTSILLRNGNFDQPGALRPFDWELTRSDEMAAEIGSDNAGRPALILLNRGGRPGLLARQLLVLAPGQYRLSFVVGEMRGTPLDRPRIVVRCLDGSVDLAATVLPEAPAQGRALAMNLAVPATGCRAQWLAIESGNPIDDTQGQQWVARMRLERLASSQPDPAGSRTGGRGA